MRLLLVALLLIAIAPLQAQSQDGQPLPPQASPPDCLQRSLYGGYCLHPLPPKAPPPIIFEPMSIARALAIRARRTGSLSDGSPGDSPAPGNPGAAFLWFGNISGTIRDQIF